MQVPRDEKHAARELGVTVHAMRAWRQRGGGPVYHKFGRRVVYYDDDLAAYKDAHRREHTSHGAAA